MLENLQSKGRKHDAEPRQDHARAGASGGDARQQLFAKELPLGVTQLHPIG